MIDKANMNGLKVEGFALVVGSSVDSINLKKVKVIKHHGIAFSPTTSMKHNYWVVSLNERVMHIPSTNLIPFGVSKEQDDYLNYLMEK